MNDSEIKNTCMRLVQDAEAYTQTLQKERADSLDYYHQEPYGDEVEGRSSFITSEVRDTIEWMLPQLVEHFIGDENPVQFAARDKEDVESAKIEGEYVRHVINNENNGFLTMYTWAKDGLLQKNGIVKVFWDENVEERKETYEDQDYPSFLKLAEDSEIEIKAVTVKYGEEEITLEEAEMLSMEGVSPEAMRYDVEAVTREDNSQARIENIPPENFLIAKNHGSLDLDDCGFCCHVDTVTASDLIVDGYPKELVDSIPTGSDQDHEEERVNRFSDEGEVVDFQYTDEAARQIQIYECYIQADFDGDGKTELRMVKLAGPNGSVLLENEIVDSVPFCAWTPVINCHKFYGVSYADMVMDLQKLRSILVRQMLDNLYLTNNPIKIVDPNGVNVEDLLYAGPGATWRGRPDAVTVHTTPFVAGASLPILELTEEMRSDRTGVSPVSQGLDPAALKDSTNLVGPMIMNQALQRVKMVVRIFAETGVRSLVGKVHELCSKYGKEDSFEYGQDFMPVNPREWKKRKRFKISVGVGHIDKMQRITAIQAILNSHRDIVTNGGLEGPLLASQNVYEALVEQAKLLGYADGEKFYRDPQTYNPPPKEDIATEALQIEEARTIADMQKKASDNKLKEEEIAFNTRKHADEMAIKREQMAQDRELKREEMVLKYGSGIFKEAREQRQDNT